LFYDAGAIGIMDPIHSEDPTKSQASRVDLRSYGVGMRFNGLGGLDAALDWARVLDSTANVEHGDSRVHFQVTYGF